MQAAAQSVAQSIVAFYASTKDEIDMVFAATARLRVGLLLVSASAYYNRNREQIVAFGDWDGRGRRSDELSDVRAESYRQASL
jgi:hypothetical protein